MRVLGIEFREDLGLCFSTHSGRALWTCGVRFGKRAHQVRVGREGGLFVIEKFAEVLEVGQILGAGMSEMEVVDAAGG